MFPINIPATVAVDLWKSFAGTNVPEVGTLVYYFPEVHAEQCDSPPALAPPVWPIFPCRVRKVRYLADRVRDEVFAAVLLQPVGSDFRGDNPVPTIPSTNQSYSKVLSPTDTLASKPLRVPARCARAIFPPLNYNQSQTLTIADVHGVVWVFEHVHRDRRHLLTSPKGWREFVQHKQLVAGDTVVFIRHNLTGRLYIAIRRKSPHMVGLSARFVEEALQHAKKGKSFEVFLYPRIPEYVVLNTDAVLVSQAGLQFIQGIDLTGDYTPPEDVKSKGFEICADELGSIVEGHDLKRLKEHGGVEGLAKKLSTSPSGGIAGTEVAKESADVIIMDDNFSTIVTVAKWRRSVYINIQKFVQFQLTVIVALVVNFSSVCLTGNTPLTAVQLLWVNMIMNTLGALALATEPPNDELMKRSPVGRKGNFITNVMWRNIFGQSVYQFVIIWFLQTKGKAAFHLDGPDSDLILNTLIFNSFVFCQVFNEISSREMEKINVFKGILQNYVLVAVLTATAIFQVIIIEFLGTFASTIPLTPQQWFVSVLFGFLGMPIAAALKMIPVGST